MIANIGLITPIISAVLRLLEARYKYRTVLLENVSPERAAALADLEWAPDERWGRFMDRVERRMGRVFDADEVDDNTGTADVSTPAP